MRYNLESVVILFDLWFLLINKRWLHKKTRYSGQNLPDIRGTKFITGTHIQVSTISCIIVLKFDNLFSINNKISYSYFVYLCIKVELVILWLWTCYRSKSPNIHSRGIKDSYWSETLGVTNRYFRGKLYCHCFGSRYILYIVWVCM